MSQPCGICLGGPNCLPSDDLNLMSLDSTVFPFVANCAPGVDCFGNSLGAGTISFPVCNQVITRSLPAGLSANDWLQIIGQMLAQAAQMAQFCANLPPGPPTIPTPPPGTPVFLYFNDPQQCTAYCPDGSPFTYTVPAGLFVGFNKIAVNQSAYAAACQKAKSQIICLNNPALGPYCGGSTINPTFVATGALSIFPNVDYWQMVDGTLPTGVSFPGGFINGGRASLQGTANSGGTFTFTIRVTTTSGSYQQKTYTFTVLNINNASPMPNGTIGTPYAQTLTQTGAQGTVTWSVSSGSLPPGLTLNTSTGAISGTPTTNGTYTFTIQVTDT